MEVRENRSLFSFAPVDQPESLSRFFLSFALIRTCHFISPLSSSHLTSLFFLPPQIIHTAPERKQGSLRQSSSLRTEIPPLPPTPHFPPPSFPPFSSFSRGRSTTLPLRESDSDTSNAAGDLRRMQIDNSCKPKIFFYTHLPISRPSCVITKGSCLRIRFLFLISFLG